jgi:hypothetical protein
MVQPLNKRKKHRLSNRWHLLIQEAINLRDHPEHRLYACRAHRGYDAVRFLHYIIRLCNEQVLINSDLMGI